MCRDIEFGDKRYLPRPLEAKPKKTKKEKEKKQEINEHIISKEAERRIDQVASADSLSSFRYRPNRKLRRHEL